MRNRDKFRVWMYFNGKVVDGNVSHFYPIHTLKALEVIGNIHS